MHQFLLLHFYCWGGVNKHVLTSQRIPTEQSKASPEFYVVNPELIRHNGSISETVAVLPSPPSMGDSFPRLYGGLAPSGNPPPSTCPRRKVQEGMAGNSGKCPILLSRCSQKECFQPSLSACFGQSHLIMMTMASVLGGQYATKITHFQGGSINTPQAHDGVS